MEITKDKDSRQPEIDVTLLAFPLLLCMSFPMISSFASGSRYPVAESGLFFTHTIQSPSKEKNVDELSKNGGFKGEMTHPALSQLLFTKIVWLIASCGYRYEPSVPEGEDFDQWEEVGFCSV